MRLKKDDKGNRGNGVKRLIAVLALAALVFAASSASLAATQSGPGASFPAQAGIAIDPSALQPDPAILTQNPAGTIAYVNDAQARDEIWLIEPDGSSNRRLWTPGPLSEGSGTKITGLSWRPDSGSLAFASDHEWLCSWYNSDIYTIFPDGRGLQRVTNAPQCADLASYPKGTVTAVIQNNTFSSGMIGVYVMGAMETQLVSFSPFSSTQVTFNNVADLGDVVQPVVAIYGGYRYFGAAYANVQPGQTVDAGVLHITGDGFWQFGAYRSSWRYDGSSIGYTTTNCTRMYHISPTPVNGSPGSPVLSAENVQPCVMAWGPTAARGNQVLYSVSDPYEDDRDGIYLATAGSSGAGTRLIAIDSFEGETIHDIQWLPDGSGFLFSMQHVDFGIMADIFEYSFTTNTLTQLTYFGDEEYALHFSISPDGQQIVFEFATEFEGATDLYTIQRDGTNIRLLVKNASHPAWSSGALQLPVFQDLYIPMILR